MSDYPFVIAALVFAALDVMIGLVGLYYLIEIRNDDRAMRITAEESLKAQIEYLGLRRKWYESRAKKKDTNASGDIAKQEGTIRVPDGSNPNAV